MTNERMILLPCADNSDSRCEGRVETDNSNINFSELTKAQWDRLEEAAERCDDLTDEFNIEIEGLNISVEPAVCSACGDPNFYDDEMRAVAY